MRKKLLTALMILLILPVMTCAQTFYYNAEGGCYYHADSHCNAISKEHWNSMPQIIEEHAIEMGIGGACQRCFKEEMVLDIPDVNTQQLSEDRYSDGLIVLDLLSDGYYRARILDIGDDKQNKEYASAKIPKWNGITPYVEVYGEGSFRLKYSDYAYACFEKRSDANWELTMWYVSRDEKGYEYFFSFYPESIRIHSIDENGDSSIGWIYGIPQMQVSLNQVDISRLPHDIPSTLDLVDISDYAIIRSEGLESIYESANSESRELGKLFSGAPLHVLTVNNGWTQIKIGEVVGWVQNTSIETGKDMVIVERNNAGMMINQDILSSDASVYEKPDTNSKPLQQIIDADDLFVMGVYNDEWYVVYSKTGISGFVESCWIFAGNG